MGLEDWQGCLLVIGEVNRLYRTKASCSIPRIEEVFWKELLILHDIRGLPPALIKAHHSFIYLELSAGNQVHVCCKNLVEH